MGVADDDAGAKDREASETDAAQVVFLHAHYADIPKPAAGCASYGRKQAKLSDPGVVAATRKGADDADFKSSQLFFAPAYRSGTDAHTAHSANRTLAQNFAGQGGSALRKVSSVRIKNDVADPRSGHNGLSRDHHHFPAFWNCQQLRDGCAADLPGTTEDNNSEIMIHEKGPLLR